MSLEAFRAEARSWLEENCPPSIRTPMPADEYPGGGKNAKFKNPETKLWLERMGEKGWVVPTWRRWSRFCPRKSSAGRNGSN